MEPDATGDERLVRFARIVAHGMRNPLAIATGMLDLLDRQVGPELDGELRDLLRRSSDAIRRAGDQLLQLQRYTAAFRDELDPEAVPVDEALAAALDRHELGGATVVLDGELPVLRADRRAVERALHEVLDNALRHAGDEGPPTIRIGGQASGGACEVVVSDDGPGIPAHQRAAALTEGERLGRTGDGFGLGLPTARVLLRRHGGDLRLEDADGGGLRVVLRWPEVPLLVEQRPQG